MARATASYVTVQTEKAVDRGFKSRPRLQTVEVTVRFLMFLQVTSEGVVRKMPSAEKREIIFPFSEAFRFSLESIRKRFTRALITVISVVLGIAFLVWLMTWSAIVGASGAGGGLAYQYWMAVIALLVCGVGIINSMLMSVTERYKEIGTMKCLGATNGNILEIFLIEAMLLGLLGGIIGALVGWLVAIVALASTLGWAAVFFSGAMSIYLMTIGEAIIAAIGISVLAAFGPAFDAARSNPADALRYEV